jgi:hypothetical protein
MKKTPNTNLYSIPKPPYRRLRAFAFDPLLSYQAETHEINEITIDLPWEDIQIGPVDEYLEVIDYDPASQCFYGPVDLNDKNLLAQDGLPPSEGNPQFHQQMVYAVARTTIQHFEKALGRRILWSPPQAKYIQNNHDGFVRHLRIFPHALREANAYYSPTKKALLFGYFPASTTDPGENLPGGIIFTCLSHDIIAHEMSHALLDGLHRRFIEPSNIDTWAFHEAFADIVALFSHFTYPGVLYHQIAKTHGDLESQNLLGGLAYQFGQAIGRYGELRSAIGEVDQKTNKWTPKTPDSKKILYTSEPHERGSILVAAVFNAFLSVYKWRIADLLRISTGGSGVLSPGACHPDLIKRLAGEASDTARHILQICIQSLDYCPPVDIDFGDYLRALITADVELVKDDTFNYRLAIIEAFRQWGIYPHDVRNLSIESLMWHKPTENEQQQFLKVFQNPEHLHKLVPDWEMTTDSRKIFEQTRESQRMLHQWFIAEEASDAREVAHIILDKNAPRTIYRHDQGIPLLEVHSVRPAVRVGRDNKTMVELIIEMTQRRKGYYDKKIQLEMDRGNSNTITPDFIFRGGCTLILDTNTARVKYCVYKKIFDEDDNDNRLERMRKTMTGEMDQSLRSTYFGDPYRSYFKEFSANALDSGEGEVTEPFRLLHSSFEREEA